MPIANKLILLDGGSNVSFMVPFHGDDSKLSPRWNWRAVPYAIQNRTDACIIGPGGGEDVLMALSHKVQSTTAVEMDPLIVKIVQGKYSNYIGHIYDHPQVQTLNDEGRSYLRRSNRQFDLIQQVHNISPMAIATGALNLSESYLLTLEAFGEYWKHLKPGGMLAINRWGIVRAASLASLALQREGIRDPENYVLITSRFRSGADESFYLKKGKITSEDIQQLREKIRELRIQIDYAPLPEFQIPTNIYYRSLVPSLRKDLIANADLNLDAPTDDKPFFDHFQRLGRFQKTSITLPGEMNQALEYLNLGDLALFTLLGEAAVLSFLFIIYPLIRVRKLRKSISQWSILAYFAALGLGFILIEISLIQKHILFLGQPVYSITAVLFFLLLAAGTGSFLFQKFFQDGKEGRWLTGIGAGLAFLILLEVTVVPEIFHEFLGSSKTTRFLMSGLLIAPLGLLLGIPFPLGIRILGKTAPDAIPWGWALNAYATVIGSILCVILAITWGFRLNLLSAVLIYFAGFAALYHGLHRNT
jgi:spermidine synthase